MAFIILITGCVVAAPQPPGPPVMLFGPPAIVVGGPALVLGPSIEIVDERGYRHRGFYDDHHTWHGGYEDEHHVHHDDRGDWHHH